MTIATLKESIIIFGLFILIILSGFFILDLDNDIGLVIFVPYFLIFLLFSYIIEKNKEDVLFWLSSILIFFFGIYALRRYSVEALILSVGLVVFLTHRVTKQEIKKELYRLYEDHLNKHEERPLEKRDCKYCEIEKEFKEIEEIMKRRNKRI